MSSTTSQEAITVVGLGHVGLVTATCLAARGRRVLGVEADAVKRERIAAGVSTINEPSLAPRLEQAISSGRMTLTMTLERAVRASRLTLVCVGTPGQAGGELDLAAVESVCDEIALALTGACSHTVLIRSTVPPGTTRRLASRMREIADEHARDRLWVGCHPEFSRVGSAVRDFDEPAVLVVGAEEKKLLHELRWLYELQAGSIVLLAPDEAELLKYATNAWHATKVAFANEIGRLARKLDVDGRRVMEELARDRRLNTSKAYLEPGLPYGGSCLPKDLEALRTLARYGGVVLPVLENVAASNTEQLERAVALLAEAARDEGSGAIGFLSVAFKPGTDEFRQSPVLAMTRALVEQGFAVHLYDENFRRDRLAEIRDWMAQSRLPSHQVGLWTSVEEVLARSRVVVCSDPSDARLTQAAGKFRVVDLAAELARSAFGKTREGGLPTAYRKTASDVPSL